MCCRHVFLNQAHAQSFVNATNLLPDTYNSGGCVGSRTSTGMDLTI